MIIPVFLDSSFFEDLGSFLLILTYGFCFLFPCRLLRYKAEDTSDKKEKRIYITIRRIIIGAFIVITLETITIILSLI